MLYTGSIERKRAVLMAISSLFDRDDLTSRCINPRYVAHQKKPGGIIGKAAERHIEMHDAELLTEQTFDDRHSRDHAVGQGRLIGTCTPHDDGNRGALPSLDQGRRTAER